MQKNKFVQILTYILLAAVIVGAVVLGIFLTNGFTQEPAPLFVEIGGKVYKNNKSLVANGNVVFRVFLTDKNADFTVKVVPNVNSASDFEYLVGNEFVKYSSIKDLTSVMSIERDGNKLTLSSEARLENVLERYYGQDVVMPYDFAEKSFYSLVITDSNGNSLLFNIRWDIAKVPPEGIELDKSEVIF